MYHDVMDRHDNLLLGLMILYQLLRELLRMGTTLATLGEDYSARYRDTDTLEATGTPAAGQSSSDGDLLSLRSHRHACRRLQHGQH